MAGDSACAKYRVVDSTTINCLNSKGESQGYRYAMTDQQLDMYRHNDSKPKPSYDYEPKTKNCSYQNGMRYCW